MHRACTRFCFRSGSERKRASERASLRFHARREHKVNPIARSTLITLLSLIVRKSRRIDSRCKALIEVCGESREIFLFVRILKASSFISYLTANKFYFNLSSLSSLSNNIHDVLFFKISISIIFIIDKAT